MNVSFGAQYVNTANLKTFMNAKPQVIEGAIVALEPQNVGDWYALEMFANRLSENNRKANYAANIRDSFNGVIEGNIVDSKLHHYVVTSQTSDFANLNSENILGAFMVSEKCKLSEKRLRSLNVQTRYVTKIRFLQGSPENYYGNENRKYSGIGKSMTDFVKKVFKNYDIVLHADKSEIPFYLSQGFERSTNPNASDMIIYRQKVR